MRKVQKFVCKSITLFLLLFVYSCVVDDKKQECPDCDCPVADQEYQNGIIFPQKARELYVNYENRRVNLIEDYEGRKDKKGYKQNDQEQNSSSENTTGSEDRQFMAARYVSYEYEDLKRYLAYVENEAKLSGEKLSTMRFYFANYANEEKFKDGKSVQHPRQNSVMLSPTVNRNQKEHIFYTIDGEGEKRKIVLLNNEFQEIKGLGANQYWSDPKSEASLLPAFLSPTNSPLMFAPRSTTKNEGSSHP